MLTVENVVNTDRALNDKFEYIRMTRHGMSGTVVKEIVGVVGREISVRVLHTSQNNLARLYRRKALSTTDTESMLDSLKTYNLAERIWGDREAAQEWLNTAIPALAGEKPMDLFDTFEGREWVRQVLRKIETGDFS